MRHISGKGSKNGGPPANISFVLQDEQGADGSSPKKDIWAMICQEARAVSIWALLSPLMRLAFAPLISQACASGESCAASNLSAIAGLLLCLFPKSVARNMAPGFIFASAWCVFCCDVPLSMFVRSNV